MRIILCFDEGYAPHAAALMEGLIDQSSVPLSFAILHTRLGEETVRTLRDHFAARVEAIDFHRVEPGMIERIAGKKMMAHLSIETYLRLFAPLFVKDRWALYLDIDVVCYGDIARIMEEVSGDLPLYAVREYDGAHPLPRRATRRLDAFYEALERRLGMTAPIHYFNAGVLLLDLDRWRSERITEQALDFIASADYLHAADQDALNAVTDGDFGMLHPRWNSAGTFHGGVSGYSDEQIAEALAHPTLIHFLGPRRKQWNYIEQSRLTRPYWKYRMRTPWPASKPADRSAKNILRRIWRRYTPPFILKAVRAAMRLLSPQKEF